MFHSHLQVEALPPLLALHVPPPLGEDDRLVLPGPPPRLPHPPDLVPQRAELHPRFPRLLRSVRVGPHVHQVIVVVVVVAGVVMLAAFIAGLLEEGLADLALDALCQQVEARVGLEPLEDKMSRMHSWHWNEL